MLEKKKKMTKSWITISGKNTRKGNDFPFFYACQHSPAQIRNLPEPTTVIVKRNKFIWCSEFVSSNKTVIHTVTATFSNGTSLSYKQKKKTIFFRIWENWSRISCSVDVAFFVSYIFFDSNYKWKTKQNPIELKSTCE